MSFDGNILPTGCLKTMSTKSVPIRFSHPAGFYPAFSKNDSKLQRGLGAVFDTLDASWAAKPPEGPSCFSEETFGLKS